MRYFIAFMLVVCGLIPLVLEGDGTVLLVMFCTSMVLIWSKTDWTKGPYKKEEVNEYEDNLSVIR